jgi:hypothetical protein
MQLDDVYERIKRDISEFPVFRFDWFFKSRSTQELQRRCNTLLSMIEKEAEQVRAEEAKSKGPKGKVSLRPSSVVGDESLTVGCRSGVSIRCKNKIRWLMPVGQ